MRWNDIRVRAGATALGRREDTATAVADGRYDPEFQAAHDYGAVCVAEIGRPEDLAVDAVNRAVSRSGVRPADIGLIIHVGSTSQNPDGFLSASYIQGKTVKNAASALDLRQTCNGAMAALELTAAYLSAAATDSSALVATTDGHRPTDVDRYRADPGSVQGDGATALVLSRGVGVARLLSTVVVGDGNFSDAEAANAVDLRTFPDRRAFLLAQRKRLLPMLESMAALQRTSVERALADADLPSSEISRWVFPNIGANMIDREFRKEFNIDVAKTTWDWGRTVGHLGSGNQFGGLTHLLETGAVRVGDRVALCGNGMGFNYGCAVLEIVAQPHWSSDGVD